ncbi:hypothetical protein BDN72DRAFT_246818 [Pluteus cervinus]|uniref:Uncharacterized protein n=1 Tax=Pluteus cervinus TaxID=181527 RepID=A0ACD3B456_9AGAR|nr:hypothetical protein BDN72DRAFT_246818 [Pluteus cervinus]
MCSKVLDNSATSLSDHSNADTVIRTTQSSKLRINSLLLSDSFESDTCVQGNCSSAMYSNPPSSPGSDTMKLSPRPLSPRLVPDDISMTCHSLADICLAQESVDTQRNSLPLENCVFEDVSRSYRGVPIASLLNYETVPEKWDSNRLSDVETLLDPTASRRQSTRERDVCKFLDQLNVDNIQKEINVFRNALQACENTPSLWGDMYEISIADMPNITPMLDLLNRDPLSLDTAYKIPIFWKDVRRTTDVADVTSACLRLLRLRALQATVKIYQWLVTLIQAAVRWDAPSSGSPWLHKLVHDVQNVFYSPHYSFGTVVEFDSWDYLPALTYPRTYSLVLPRFSSTPMDDIKAYSAIIARFWLGFPPDLPSLSVAGVLTELLDAHSIIILLLDPVWELFSSQGCNLMSSLKQDQRARPRYHIELLETVSSRLKVHPIRDPASPECLKLQELSTSMSLWIGPQNNKLVEDLKPMLLESPHTGPIHKDVPDILSHLPPADLQGVAALLSFIRRLLPLLNSIHLPPDDLAKFVAKNLDFRSPFRQRAPTLQRAFATIYSDLDRLQTTAGLFNVVLFRGFTYGSSWARTSLNWFNDYSTWKSVYDNSTVPADAKSRSSYFINPCAYGTCASARDLAHSKKIEKALTKSGWCAFIEAQRRVKDSCLSEQFFFFKQFPAVGSLTSLLIVGDLIKAGLLPIPVAYDFGILVAHVKRGALNGLVRLGLVSHESSSEEIAEAFENLHLQLLEDLTLDEIRMMDYDIVTLEHILCKFSRLHNEI